MLKKKIVYFIIFLNVFFIGYIQFINSESVPVYEYFLGCNNDETYSIKKTEDKLYKKYIDFFNSEEKISKIENEVGYNSLKVFYDGYLIDDDIYAFRKTDFIFKFNRENLSVNITNRPLLGEKEFTFAVLKCESMDNFAFIHEKEKVVSKYKFLIALSNILKSIQLFRHDWVYTEIAYKLAKKRILSENLSKVLLIGEISSILISLYLLFFLTPLLEYIFRFLAQGFSSIINSIERAVYKSSPLPGAPDGAVFDSELLFLFRVN